jgi:chromosome segregation ATPase
MRYTPQSVLIPEPSADHKNQLTCISDTSASENSRLVTRLEETRSELFRLEREHREKEVMWDKQQTEHENRAQDYRRLLNEKREVDRAFESRARDCDKLRAQLEAKAAEVKSLRDELEVQRTLGLESNDEKDVQITRLRKELETTQFDRDHALKSVASTESTLEYTKEQYRIASNAAGQLQTDVTSLQIENAKLAHQASGEVAKLKALHFDRSSKNLIQQNRALMSENSQLKTTLKQKEDELIRAKSNSVRVGYGTRAHSTTPQPKTRSRAASPTNTRGGRGGRIGDLRLEER